MANSDTKLAVILEEKDPAIPVPARMAHIVFYTAKYAEMKAWYQRVFNATLVRERHARQAFFTFDSEHHRILVSHQPHVTDRPRDSAGVAHVAWTYENLKDLFSTYDRLKNAGIMPDRTVNHGMTTSLYYRDPDNNRIELQVENFDDPIDAIALVQSDAFDNTEFDADSLSAAVASGISESRLKSQRNLAAMIESGEI